ncbi:SDR family oxidoreductase [Candidatus Symbiobacter mobilis]|uniref:Short-chain alcohol dehydrogenase-like protein n=1 Tax=Candidatus Symbiobacter mobilis CR TaxID=946483 RepID=U5N5R6_9BURK|nr:SDR family oxidoreductase [Candidatus Symbiobacter mobilis]AGX86707.1 short-chain alcohol dehydrogenase-like protein [Candidatus Symbiobacter mobilis CR]
MPNQRIIVLTGATRGLGRALLTELVAAGHTVAGCGRNARDIETLRATYPAPHSFATVDVRNDDEVAAWAVEVLQSVGVPDLLVNNAALMNTPAPLWKVPASEFDTLMAVNVCGVATVIRHVVPAMVQNRRGVIVNLSSGWGRSVSSNVAPYCASKWAIEGLTKALAEELPAGMAAVPLNPGIIDTDMLRQSFGAAASGYESPEHWAHRAATFILSLGPKDSGKSLSVS